MDYTLPKVFKELLVYRDSMGFKVHTEYKVYRDLRVFKEYRGLIITL
jgi:hypothetical protein